MEDRVPGTEDTAEAMEASQELHTPSPDGDQEAAHTHSTVKKAAIQGSDCCGANTEKNA